MQCASNEKRQYRVITHAEREEIMIGRHIGESIRSIARRLGRNPSVIARELKSNSTEDGRYQAYWANSRSRLRRRQSRQKDRIADTGIRQYVHDKLKLEWSPEQIAGRIEFDLPEKRVSHETIYMYIFKKRRDLTQHLVRGRKNRRKRYQKRGKRTLIPLRTGIEERPTEVELRQERGLGITLLAKLPRCAPKEMNTALIEKLKELPRFLCRSITFDNGQENRYHIELREDLGINTYFCNPYSSWEKGSVENAVGLTRRVWPKKTDYALISDEDVAMLEYRLKHTSQEAFWLPDPI